MPQPGRIQALDHAAVVGDRDGAGLFGDDHGDGIADLRIGLHLQGLSDGESETYINGTPPGNSIPLPSTAGLAAAGLLMVGTIA